MINMERYYVYKWCVKKKYDLRHLVNIVYLKKGKRKKGHWLFTFFLALKRFTVKTKKNYNSGVKKDLKRGEGKTYESQN